MEWKTQSAVLICEISCGFLFGRFLIPLFRKIKTGKLDFYIGDRFRQDGSEPKFGGAVILLTVMLGFCIAAALSDTSSNDFSGTYDLRYILLTACYCVTLTLIGAAEDYQRETKKGIGLKKLHKFLAELAASAGFLTALKLCGFESSEVLLPFRLGYISMGYAYIPLTALFMTVLIAMTENHDCQNGSVKTGVDGLCTLSVMLAAVGLAAGICAGNVTDEGHKLAALVSVCTAGGCSALLFWCICPSKLYQGQSGSILLGGLLGCIAVFSGLYIAALLAVLSMVIDAACYVLQRAVFSKSKRLLLKGASLHEHLTAIGWGEYKIMCADIFIQALGCSGAVAFAVYESTITI